MSLNLSFVLRGDIPKEYFCISCKSLVYPDSAVQAPCHHLICNNCRPHLRKCECPEGGNTLLTRLNCQTIAEDTCAENIWRVFVHCANRDEGCMWTGTLSEYATTHRAFCLWGLHGFDMKAQQAKDLLTSKTTKEMAKMYPHAYFVWSWKDELIDGQPVLSDLKIQTKGMCAFFSSTSVFEANLRLKGYGVKQLSWKHLHYDFLKEKVRMKALKVPKESTVITICRILQSKGMIELSADGVALQPEKRHKISKFKKFNMKTTEGISEAVNHVHDHGPIICVYGVTKYQGGHDTKSAGVIHVVEDRKLFDDAFADDEAKLNTHAVCTIGIGSEDLTSFFSYQDSKGLSYREDGYGRVLAYNILEAVGLFCYENYERPCKKAKA